MHSNFADRLIVSIEEKQSRCVVGLDPIPSMFPAWLRSASPIDATLELMSLVIETVAPLVPVIKPQAAYFEALGPEGVSLLWRLKDLAQEKGLLVLLDAKRGDIPSTAAAYAQAYIAPGGFDAMTVNPYLGPDTIEPFVDAARSSGAGIFVCAMTSNIGAPYLQNALMEDGEPVYLKVAKMLQPMVDSLKGREGYSGLGIVSGATFPEQATELRRELPNSFFLVPGMGAQGGDGGQLGAFFNADGLGAVVSSSRSILYPRDAQNTKDESEEATRRATLDFVNQVNSDLLMPC